MASEVGGGAAEPVEVFFSYSHKDETLRKRLEDHLSVLRRQGVISGWHDRMIGAGQEWKGEIDRRIESARVILLLISPSFLASDYCYDIEMKRAIQRHDDGEATVIPVILRPCDWHGAPFGKLQGLPKDTKAVTSWRNQDEAFKNVAEGIRGAITGTMERPSPPGKSQVSPSEGQASPAEMPAGNTGGGTKAARGKGSKNKASQAPGTARRGLGGRGRATDSSGMLVLLDGRFFEAESVEERGGMITVVAASEDAAVDAAVKGLRPPLHGSPKAIGYAHVNDAMIVRVKTIDSRTELGKKRWFITLVPERIEHGGQSSEATILTKKGRFSPEEIARLRASRILLNTPLPPRDEDRPWNELGTLVEEGLVESSIQGVGAAIKVTSSGVREICSNQSIPMPQRFMIARLMAVFQLIVGDAVEHVQHLSIGPIAGNKVHVEFRGTRRKIYSNVEPIEIRVEGDCLLS